MWQELREELHPKGLEIVTVALDSGGAEAARPYVQTAGSRHPTLIDVGHSLDALLGVVNIPTGVWIDEAGMLVRPPETAAPQNMTRMLTNLELPPETPRHVVDRISPRVRCVTTPSIRRSVGAVTSDGGAAPLRKPEQVRRGRSAQLRALAARLHRRQPPSLDAHVRVADGVDPTVESMESPTLHAHMDFTMRQPARGRSAVETTPH